MIVPRLQEETTLLTGSTLADFNQSYGATFSNRSDPTYGNVIRAVVPANLANVWDAQLIQPISSAVQIDDVIFVEFYVSIGDSDWQCNLAF